MKPSISTSLTSVKDTVPDAFELLPLAKAKLRGFAGRRLDLTIKNRILAQDADELLQPFRDKTDTRETWRCEFWGKWFTSLADALIYTDSPEAKKLADYAVRGLLATQSPDGYIGTQPDASVEANWDIWGRKYSLLGLLAYYEITGEPAILEGAKRLGDHLIKAVAASGKPLHRLGLYRGMPSSSVLEPLVKLARLSGEKRFLDFAMQIVEAWKKPDGPDLIGKALATGSVTAFFPQPPAEWWVWENGWKAYEIMSCYEGVCELYRSTGKQRWLDAVLAFHALLSKHEMMIVGSGSAMECWCDGAHHQTETFERPIESCTAMLWIKLCAQLLRITGESRYADDMELSFYNAFFGSMAPDGSWYARHNPLEGFRDPEERHQVGIKQNCCVANGPRVMMMFPALAVMTNRDGGVAINFFSAGTFNATLASGNVVTIEQETNYPVGGAVAVHVTPARAEEFALAIRIPRWAKPTTVRVGSETYLGTPGTYLSIRRTWQAGDVIAFEFDMAPRVLLVEGTSKKCGLARGPIVLAVDARLNPQIALPTAREEMRIHPHDLSLTLCASDANSKASSSANDIWMRFKLRLASGRELTVCDYASAGNTWDTRSSYTVWFEPAKPTATTNR
ncbi:hypothetical protein Ga0100231_010670 [Opitutaceae bacterium TAV4]|nr:hypothetical protein Ga0100231_010670 [Opitutaceae bacterium TAV4]RRJ98806.1 hypothetical protein Ga0100230_010780 [Opitutaceae bacterium TAV3]